MRRAVYILCLFFITGSLLPSFGQKLSNKPVITGYVTDVRHFPVVGSVITIDNNQTGVVTDENGFYKVRITPDAGSIGVFSYAYGVLEEDINGRTRINFTFPGTITEPRIQTNKADVSEENEEINIGYGTRDRSNLTTSVSNLNNSDNRYSAYSSIYDMLQGSVPGVMVNKGNVLIRGVTSLRQSNEPLFIVNGIPVTSIQDIAPQMVKSISVLKGAAAAIYGSRGANGVILIDLFGAPSENELSSAELARIPTAVTQSATNIQAKSATLNGVVAANDISAFVSFEYGTTTGYGNRIAASQSPVTGSSHSGVTAIVTDLLPGITYHCRVVATNSAGSTFGMDIPFTTLGEAPSAKTDSASNISPVSAHLSGFVNPGNLTTVITYEFGTDTNYSTWVAASQSPVNGSMPVKVTGRITGLVPGATYHYRIVATNEKGTAYGNDATFKAEYVIGEKINGGYIFYIDKSGEHGLVCAPSDQSDAAVWGDCPSAGATGKAVGTGYQNTAEIIDGCPEEVTAAGLCHDLEMNGYNDWYLPSVNELLLMYTNLHDKGLGSFEEAFYWSSTQDRFGAWVVSFLYGSKSNHSRNEKSIRTRAIRAF